MILDGQTLEPFKVVSTRSYTYDTEEYHPEPRVAAIVASHFKPEWIINIKETGQVWLVNYTDPIDPTIKMIEAERFLHDGGWDATRRYFLVAANQSNKIAVVDAQEGKLEALVETHKMSAPRPRRQLDRSRIRPGVEHLAPGRRRARRHRHRPGGPPETGLEGGARHPRCRRRAACSSRPTPTARGSGWT